MAGINWLWKATVKLLNYYRFICINYVHFGDTQERKIKVPLMAQMKTLSKNYKLYYLSYWYFITFWCFLLHLVFFLPNYLVNHFGIDK